jgi:hypothetical protein
MNVDQACGTELDAVLEARQRIAAESGRLEDLVPLGVIRGPAGVRPGRPDLSTGPE